MKDLKPRERVIQLLLLILSAPYRYSKKQLADHFGKSIDTIDEDIKAIGMAGLLIDKERKMPFRLALLPDRQFDELKHLLPLSNTERARIADAVNKYFSGKDAFYYKQKLATLYDFQQLGIRALRRPALERIDRLEAARKNKQLVILKSYRSNSDKIRDRRVEPFHLDVELNTVQAFDVDIRESRHFLLPRIDRVELTDLPWENETYHQHKLTDVFRIADQQQEMIHLRLHVQAYNLLIETYPKAKSEIELGAEPNRYDFQSKVNKNFYGLLPFILANAEHVDILASDRLKQAVREEAAKIQTKFN